jgi:hypothetical protein
MDNFQAKINQDVRGSLGVIELTQIPFTPKRFFWIFDTPENTSRASHAHKSCKQFLMVQKGVVVLQTISQEQVKSKFRLDVGDCIFLDKLTWLDLMEFSDGAVLGVWASEIYNRAEYIETLEEFISFKSS